MRKKLFVLVLFSILISLSAIVMGGPFGGGITPGYGNNWQYYQPTINRIYSGDASTYWPILSNFENDQCDAASDFAIMIPPGGCSPGVVRSDLLAEQNVPVFCQLQSVQINPLIKVSSIKSISFKGDYPEGVAGVTFHPARAATRSYRTLLGSPIVNNIGYVVIIMKRERVEENMEDWVAGNLTATIFYDAEEAYGVGEHDYYLNVLSDEEWEDEIDRSAFWKGQGYVRLEGVGEDSATINLYRDKDKVFRSLNLKEGQTSEMIYYPGYYCRAGLSVKLDKIDVPGDSVLLNVDGVESWVREGSKILQGQCRVRDIDFDKDEEGAGKVKISCPGKTFSLELKKREDEIDLKDGFVSSEVGKLYEELNETVVGESGLVETFGSVQKDVVGETFGEEALLEQIDLAKDLGFDKARYFLLSKFIEKYPSSNSIDYARRQYQLIGEFDYTQAFENVLVVNEFHTFSLVELKKINKSEKKVKVEINGKLFELFEGENKSENGADYRIDKIDFDEVKISHKKSSLSPSRFKSEPINEDEFITLSGNTVIVRDIDLEAYAHIRLIPRIQNTKTEAEFTFKIGIEKRNIKLSPERTEEMIESLNDTIERWTSMNDRLGDLIKAWKGACFATSSILMLKNVASGFSGSGLARQKVMQKYKSICQLDYPQWTPTQCYNELSDEINEDVEKLSGALNSVNDKFDERIGDHLEGGGLFSQGTVVNDTAYVDDIKKEIPGSIFPIDVGGQEIYLEDLKTATQVRAVLTYSELKGNGGIAEEVTKAEMERDLRYLSLQKKTKATNDASVQRLKAIFGGETTTPIVVSDIDEENFRKHQWSGQVFESFNDAPGVSGVEDNKKIQFFNYNSKDYMFVLGGSVTGAGTLGIEKAYEVKEEGNWELEDNGSFPFLFYVGGSSEECSNDWPEGTAKISFYETGVNKGLPAIVPFDLNGGWYAMVPNSAGTFLEDSPQGYQSSAALNYFQICNIGPDRTMQRGQGDDLCQSFDINTAGAVDRFNACPSMDSSDVKDLFVRATEAVRRASSQYGSKHVNIFDQLIEVGEPSGVTGGFECQDFMSPEDCLLMFNVCDPVICPSSRCDLGGKMPVSDVIQTGVVGGLMMCLPNAKEGIKVPICLSGIHAGIDAYLSILQAEAACLQRSLDTGEYVGICDELTSIYTCQLFWEQAAPVTRLLLPSLIDTITGGNQRARGGGEYLLVQSAFDNLDKSLEFFKGVYAPNAFRAFELRSIEEAGGEFCRAFIGTSLPTSAEALDDLLEPESPPQFYAYFSEKTFTDATIPPTSQYNVYYHIYAGNDRSINYQVYLKDPPATSYYYNNPTVGVRTGFVAAGTSADESLDFTAPSGYKELCVVINAQEYCGFGQVTSDFGLNYVQDRFVENQIDQSDITSEKECISGTPSLVPSLSPNIQDTVESTFNPDINLRGIVRVCAIGNPSGDGLGTRWKDVGYCGDVNNRCWLDTASAGADLKTLEATQNLSLSQLDAGQDVLSSEISTQEEVQAVLSVSEKKVGGEFESIDFKDSSKTGPIFLALEKIIGTEAATGFGTDIDIARAMFVKAKLYIGMIRSLMEGSAETIDPEPRPVDDDGSGYFSIGEDSTLTYAGNPIDFHLVLGPPGPTRILQKSTNIAVLRVEGEGQLCFFPGNQESVILGLSSTDLELIENLKSNYIYDFENQALQEGSSDECLDDGFSFNEEINFSEAYEFFEAGEIQYFVRVEDADSFEKGREDLLYILGLARPLDDGKIGLRFDPFLSPIGDTIFLNQEGQVKLSELGEEGVVLIEGDFLEE